MDTQIMAIFCLCDDLLKELHRAITIGFIAGLLHEPLS